MSRKLPLCDTTMTPRLPDWYCKGCATYPGNMGPCRTFEKGKNGRCVYCDHSIICHGQHTVAEARKGKAE